MNKIIKNILDTAQIVLVNIIAGVMLFIIITLEMIINFIRFDYESSKKSVKDLCKLLKMIMNYKSYKGF